MSIFSFLSHLFNALFHATRDAWNKLPPATQKGLLNGSGILHIINLGIDADPKAVIATIQAEYPSENLDVVYTGLVAVCKFYNILPSTAPADLEGVVVILQKFLKTLETGIWPNVMNAAAGILATILSGQGTPFEIVATLLQFVYTNFIKPKIVTIVTLPAQTNVAA